MTQEENAERSDFETVETVNDEDAPCEKTNADSQEEKTSVEATKKRIWKKKTAVVLVCLVAVIAIGALAAFVAVPAYEYSRGMDCLDQGDYQEAKECFSRSNKDDSNDYIAYCAAMIAMSDNDYETALANLVGLDVRDSADRLKEAYYEKGQALFEKGSLEDAKNAFIQSDDYQDASSRAVLCQNAVDLLDAENEYSQGHLGRAQDKFKSLPNDFEYRGVNVASRLKILSDNRQIVDLCGTWTNSGTATGSTRQYWSAGDNRWEGWDLDMTGRKYKLDVSCIINDNGKIRYKGSAEYEYPTNYSSLSSLVKTSKDRASFDVTFDGLPDTLYEKDSVELTYQAGTFVLSYNKYDDSYSAHFNYEYSCNVVYDTRTTTY